jgi:hypothetical protein
MTSKSEKGDKSDNKKHKESKDNKDDEKTESKKQKTDKLKVYISMDDLTCPVCYEIMIEPILYPCAHRVCRRCTKEMFLTPSADKQCPKCRARVNEKILKNVDTFVANITRQAPIKMPCGNTMTMEEYENHEKDCLTCCREALRREKDEKMRDRGRAQNTGGGGVASTNVFTQPGTIVEYYTQADGNNRTANLTIDDIFSLIGGIGGNNRLF